LPLSSFYLFTAIEAVHIPLFSAVFTDWLSAAMPTASFANAVGCVDLPNFERI
jgi:hypothetical protein